MIFRKNLVFWSIALISLIPFIVLAFLNVRTTDDYLFETYHRELGFWGAQHELYTKWIGRFVASFLQIVFVRLGAIEHFYFLHTLVLLIAVFLALYFVLSRLNRYLANDFFSKATLWKAAFILCLLNMYVMDDIASQWYWFSGAFTYQLPVILGLLLTGCIITRLYSADKMKKTGLDVLNIMLIISICGCNETAAIILLILLAVGCLLAYYYRHTSKNLWLFYLLVAFTTFIIVITTSGIIKYRLQVYPEQAGVLKLLSVLVFRALSVFYNIFKEPLYWISMVLAYQGGKQAGSSFTLPNRFFTANAKAIIYKGSAGLLLVMLVPLGALIFVTKGSFPPRALNVLILLMAYGMLLLVFMAGVMSRSKEERNTIHLSLPAYLYTIIICCCMLCSTCYANAWKSIFPAYFYHRIMQDRDLVMKKAKEQQQSEVTLLPYDVALNKAIQQTFPGGVPVTMRKLFLEKPSVILFDDMAERAPTVLERRFGLKKVRVANE